MVPTKRWVGKGPGGRKVELTFEGGAITSDAGVLALSAADDRLGLLRGVTQVISDPRDQTRIDHEVESMLRQRVYAIALGYEDLNDHTTLRHDIAFQTASKSSEDLASSPTLCRMEQWADRPTAWNIHKVLLDTFFASFDEPPEQLILDFDATDDRVHGMQEGRHFNGYYDAYVFLPLVVTCGDQLLVHYLRPGRFDAAMHAGAILKLLVTEIRKKWPSVQIIFRADGGFCREHILGWCERNKVLFVVGLPKNPVLNRMSEFFALRAQYAFLESTAKSRVIDSFYYTPVSGSWRYKTRKVIARVEFGEGGLDNRFIVTNIKGESRMLYEDLYCQRGQAENHIKDLKLTLFSDRTSCKDWHSNQFRVLLSSLAYVLFEHIRRVGLGEPDPAFCADEQAVDDKSENQSTLPRKQTSFATIRLRLLKIGGVIVRNTRRIIFRLSSAFPLQKEFFDMMARLEGPA
jgi:hypothetical protein